MRQIIYDQNFLKIDYDIRKVLFEFCRWTEIELVEEEFDHFWFKIKIVDGTILLYLLYRNVEDERILTWHIYLQEELNKFFKEVDLGDLEIVIIVECADLWNKG
jgi:hypothetical protein